MKTLSAHLRKIQQRLGRREELVAGAVLVMLAIGGVSFTLITRIGTPAGAALAYMAAVDQADSDYVWSHSIVDATHASSASVSLLDKPALTAQLTATAHTRSGFTVQGVSFVGAGTKVTLNYSTPTGPQRVSLVMQGGAPHSWPVVLEPAGIEMTFPPGAGAFSIDGRKLDTTTISSLKIAVLPGQHRLSMDASHLYLPYVADIYAEAAFPATSALSFTKVKLTDAAAGDAESAVNKVIQNCATRKLLTPTGCPQSYASDTATVGAAWSVLGDPLAGASVGLNGKSELEVTGHYLMQLGYSSALTHGTRVIAVGGPYAARLTWDGQAFSISGFEAPPPARLMPQPSATDAQILLALKTQFDSCLKIQAPSAAGCPQHVAAFDASNFVWRANGDPVQGAGVTWDATEGFYRVTGNYDFSVDYDSTPPYSPTRHYQDNSSGQYVADLYWDGSKAVFVGFEK